MKKQLPNYRKIIPTTCYTCDHLHYLVQHGKMFCGENEIYFDNDDLLCERVCDSWKKDILIDESYSTEKTPKNKQQMKATIIREFDYAHKLPNYEGSCANLHGHRGKLEITFVRTDGENTNDEGFVADFKKLKEIIDAAILSEFDHKYINRIIYNPTCENMVEWIIDQIEESKPMKIAFEQLKVKPVKIKMYETPDSFIECHL
ncbi:MAG: 6-pyruvoyl trahydropterin synthase family protein [Bacteroidota bacterium]